nr:pentapeptide repeat-containing protein [Trinickia fusca]
MLQADLSKCIFEKCHLDDVCLSESLLHGCTMSSTHAVGADFCGAHANGFNCVKCDLSACRFHDARIESSVFSETRLERADFTRAIVHKAVFYRLDLKETIFLEATFNDAVFAEASLVGQRLRGQQMFRCQFAGADLRNVDFTAANLARCNFQGAKLSGARLDGVDAPYAIFFETDAHDVNCRHAALPDSIWVQADIRNVDFTGSKLNGAVLQRTRCNGSRFSQTSLEGVDFSYADLTEAEFDGASFARTAFHGAIEPDIAWREHPGAVECDPELSEAQAWSRQRDESSHRDDH